jgi:2-polyprenyl-3-methyl-5-hydroxy-6-metoxy-1,4-benzoquinol methylase
VKNVLRKICPICESDNLELLGELYDDRYGYPGLFPLLKCTKCRHGFLQGEFSSGLLRDLYSNYYPRSSFDLESYTPDREITGFKAWLDGEKSAAFRWVPRNIRVLDIGCGFGESLGYHQARGCDVYGVEADENIRRVAEKFGFKVHVGLFDPCEYEADFFDYVTMNQVIEHFTDPLQTLRGVARILKPGGVAVLSTPNAEGWGRKVFGNKWINWHAPYHIQLFSNHSMRLAAEQVGLGLDDTVSVTHSAWLYFQLVHLLTYPEEGKPSFFWGSDAASKIDVSKRFAFKLFNLAYRCKVTHLITRIFDLVEAGDNKLYFLRKPL